MSFMSILLFLLKYGPSIFQLIKAAIELIRWLRENDDEAVMFADAESVKSHLDRMAKRCRAARNNVELEQFVENLRRRKEIVMEKRGL
jgi:hypothetical protein